MRHILIRKHFLLPSLAVGFIFAASPVYAIAGPIRDPLKPTNPGISDNPKTHTATPDSSTSTTEQAQQTAQLKLLQKRANAEIERRIVKLNSLTTLITNSKKLNATDKSNLQAEITGEINGDNTFMGLKNLQAKIDSDTTLAIALQDKQSIVTEYRVFVFIVPQVHIVSVADQQQTIENKISDFAANILQTRITAAQNQGKDVSSLQTQLDSMKQSVANATSLSSSTEQKVIALRPADYDGNTTILKQYRQNLQTAHQDNQTAINDAKQIAQRLEKL